MSSKPERVQDLFDRIADCLPRAVKFKGVAFRSAGVKYASEGDLISGSGASYYGGRWNPPGVKAIYASLDPTTAVKESYQEFIKYGFEGHNIKPRVMAGVKLNLERLLNLTDARIRRKLGFRLDELTAEDWHAFQSSTGEPWTQAIGKGALRAGFEGLLAPSARDQNGTNAVIFPENLASKSTVVLLEKEELPPHPSKWPT